MPERADTAMPVQDGPDDPAHPPSAIPDQPLFDELPEDDDLGDEFDETTSVHDDTDVSATHHAAPAVSRSVQGGARVGPVGAAPVTRADAIDLPAYLVHLCEQPGVSREDFEGIDCRTAWVQLVGFGPFGSKTDTLPLAH